MIEVETSYEICVEHFQTTRSDDIHCPHETLCLEGNS
jgi:hypothetical protein